MHTRDERRFLTEKYVKRQVRLDRMYKGGYSDKLRRPADAVMAMLFLGDDYCPDHPAYGSHYAPPSNRTLGRWRNLSFTDCGVPKCPMCGNPRRLTTRTGEHRLTMQERKANEAFNEQMSDYLMPAIDQCDSST
jgi:hypothetical protein